MNKILKLIWEAIRGEERSYTTGNINKAIILLSIPMILEMVMEAFFAIVDVFFVSKISINAVATVGLTESVITLVYSIAIGLSMATTAMVSRRIGEGDPDQAAVAAVQSIYIALTLSFFISIFGIIFARDILSLMGGSQSLIDEGIWYTRIIFGGNFVIMLLFLLNAVFRGAGDAAIAMRALWIANILNIILDPCLIFGWGPFPEMGIAGAAVATTIGRGIGVAFQLYILLRGRVVVKILRRHLKVVWGIILRLLNVSLGGMGQYIIASASWIFLMRIMAEFGEMAVAGYTISIRMLIFAILPAWGMANAAATLVGQNLGAEQPAESRDLSLAICFFYHVISSMCIGSLFCLCRAHGTVFS